MNLKEDDVVSAIALVVDDEAVEPGDESVEPIDGATDGAATDAHISAAPAPETDAAEEQ
jgi:hypothetical protein